MNQQAFYRDTAIGEFQLDVNGFLAYRSYGERKWTIKARISAWKRKGDRIFAKIPNA